MTRADRRTLVRQLRAEGLSQRAIAGRLNVSKDTVRRDVEAIDRETEPEGAPQDAPDDPDAPQVSTADEPEGAPDDAPPSAPVDAGEPDGAAPDEPRAPVAQLPRRTSPERLDVDLRQWPALRRDLAVLAATGLSPEALIHQAVVVLAFGYKQGVRSGQIRPDHPFVVRDMTVSQHAPPSVRPRRPEPAPPAGGA
ncbi:HTH domain-containing protein [Streptomyces sp. NPDC020951]|uniref:HTH domain-containing protein n=1 Tax=Streptomyces sp. NPDC020951 TaxID=3365104 RepID=UPI0037A27931